MKKIDYSSDAISRRLRKTEHLRVLSLSLMKAKKAHDEKLAKKEAEQSTPTKHPTEQQKEPIS